ncbi:hypothetical protein PJ15_1512 [Acinetobacter sp. neg1]|uniref:hypothetical protein n=1 Tax=Acinetobacter sp. neg1 TaxID=1561068 RepID=UPI0005431AC5|nr:hypothetical protein [Acinetobacter sp. neg1]KHF78453.1 hypothetical protein PJ15_1512 [Acinetobacter sp. neg1]
MIEFINEHFVEILTFIGGLVSAIALTITYQKTINKRDKNTTNQNNNKVKARGDVKFIGGDDNSKE